jgi:hypothetical protein
MTSVVWSFDPVQRDMSRAGDVLGPKPVGTAAVPTCVHTHARTHLCAPSLSTPPGASAAPPPLPTTTITLAHILCVTSGAVNVAVDGEHGAASMLMDPPLPVFKYLADNYRIHGAPPVVLCKFNAEV